jgi:hypothetical protein
MERATPQQEDSGLKYRKQVTKKLGTDMDLDITSAKYKDVTKTIITEPDSGIDLKHEVKMNDVAGLTGIAGTEMLSQTYINENDNSL